MRRYWNHNTHYLGVLLNLLPPPCERAVDVGCGDGLFARQLSAHAALVVALDSDAAQLRCAKARCVREANVTVVHAVGHSMPFPDGSFDAVTSLAVIHHLPLGEAVA